MSEIRSHHQAFVDFLLARIREGDTLRCDVDEGCYCCDHDEVSDLRIELPWSPDSEEVFNATVAHLCNAYRAIIRIDAEYPRVKR